MWLMTKHGFYSVVRKTDGYHVRTRELRDLKNLVAGVPLKAQIFETPAHDYRYRILVGPEDLGEIVGWLAANINYDNFKARIDGDPEQAHKPYHDVWAVMARALGAYGKPGKSGGGHA